MILRKGISLALWLTSVLLVTPGLYITSPQQGSMLGGIVEVIGSVPTENFVSAEVSYSYANASVETWFLISRINQPVQDGVLVKWDTTTITDGLYNLKLTVMQSNRKTNEVVVENITVSNYTHGVTTQEPLAQETELIPGDTPVPLDNAPHSVSLPANPGAMGDDDLMASLKSGLVAAILALGTLGIYGLVRYRARK